MNGVPLTRRILAADRRRLGIGVVGVGLAVMLILLLDGLWAGIQAQSRVYAERAGADLYVLQPGIRDLTAGAGALPLATVDTVRAEPDVRWAAPVRAAYAILDLHGHKVPTYLVGSVPGQPGGAWSLTKGRTPRADDEITLGRVLAGRHGIGVGDTLPVMGRQFRVVGLSRSTGFMLDYSFLTHSGLADLAGSADTTSFVLVGTDEEAAVAARLRGSGLNVMTRDQVAAANQELATGIFGSPVRLMTGIGLVTGTMIIALTAYTAITDRRREYGIVKALGARAARLRALALAQTSALAGLGLAAGVAFFAAGRAVIEAARPQFAVVLSGGSLVRAGGAAVLMALLAAVLPARRLATLEPAAAFRSPG